MYSSKRGRQALCSHGAYIPGMRQAIKHEINKVTSGSDKSKIREQRVTICSLGSWVYGDFVGRMTVTQGPEAGKVSVTENLKQCCLVELSQCCRYYILCYPVW